MFFVYVLRSAKTGRFYTGHTADVAHRLGQHNEGITKSTRHERPWKLVHQEEFTTRAEATRRERYWKTRRAERSCVGYQTAAIASSAG